MGQLVSIFLALGSLALSDLGPSWRVGPPWIVFFLLVVPYLAAPLARRAGLRGGFRRAAAWARLVESSPVLIQLAAVGLFGWVEAVEGWLGTDISLFEWPRMGLFAALAPFLGASVLAIDAEARFGASSVAAGARMRGLQFRMFLSGLAPVALYIALASLARKDEVLRIRVEEVGLYSAAFSAALLLIFVLALPWVLQHTWNTRPFPPGRERDLLEALARGARFRCKDIYLWDTGGLLANAAIVGMTPGTRRVFLSDALLRRLGPRELAAVFAHEVGHARQHHVPLFLVWALALFGGLDLLVRELDPDGGTLALSLLAAGLGLWFAGFGWLSRRVELEADLFSHELTGERAALSEALAQVAGGRAERRGWRHFSMAQRVAFLARAESDPRVGRRLRRLLGRLRWLGGAALMVVLALQARALFAQRGSDLARADLRLGRYESAAARLENSAEVPEELRALVNLARTGLGRDFEDRDSAARACEARRRAARSPAEAGAWEALADYVRPAGAP